MRDERLSPMTYKKLRELGYAALDSIMPDEGRIKISTRYEDI